MSSPSAISYPTAIAHAVLSFSSAWAIFQVQECLFAVIGFSLYLINGILGVLAYGQPGQFSKIAAYRRSSHWCYLLILALFCSQVCSLERKICGQFLSYLNLAVPVMQLFVYEAYEQDIDETVAEVFQGICFLIHIHMYRIDAGDSYRVLNFREMLYFVINGYLFFTLGFTSTVATQKLCTYALCAAFSEILYVNNLSSLIKKTEAAKGSSWAWQ
ncbi:uncharacterized protein [Halyomorpha halys]|uniref:uncharacterized protein n=1 Tax=Halyomorpha halys TaxID=286706 RepID=UPI0006D51154|nr:uncharacterized protein LOC106687410 isoform X1 [Halyomorpha halys]